MLQTKNVVKGQVKEITDSGFVNGHGLGKPEAGDGNNVWTMSQAEQTVI